MIVFKIIAFITLSWKSLLPDELHSQKRCMAVLTSGTSNVKLFGNRVFINVVRLKWDCTWLGWALVQYDWCPSKYHHIGQHIQGHSSRHSTVCSTSLKHVLPDLSEKTFANSGLDNSAWALFSCPVGSPLSSLSFLLTPKGLMFSRSSLMWVLVLTNELSQHLTHAPSVQHCSHNERILAVLLGVHNHSTIKPTLGSILPELCVGVRLWGHGGDLHYKMKRT